ncbi:MAG: hypothetical protein ACRCTY_08655, partial [Candidatus Adiutrix sp.]
SSKQDRDYANQAIRTLGTYGCTVHLVKGFFGFMALIDGQHFSFGHFGEPERKGHIWGGLKSALLPNAAPTINDILQIKLINEKLGRRGGGVKTCRQCGWPMVLINQEQMRGHGDKQPFKLGCLGEHGQMRLDEREPFLTPPLCGQDGYTPYERKTRGKISVWLCPKHPSGAEASCPAFKAINGDKP